MGGSINVTVRKTDGQIFNLDSYTNSMPYWLRNIRIYNCDDTHLEEYIEEHRPTAQLIPTGTAPSGYGLVLVDYMTKTFLSMQGYCGFDEFSTIELTGRHERKENFLEFLDAGLIEVQMLEVNKSNNHYEKTGRITGFDNIKALLDSPKSRFEFDSGTKDAPYYNYEINWSPKWTYWDSESSLSTSIELYRKVKDLGFDLDINGWREWFEENGRFVLDKPTEAF
jgi:hypothetical protein